MALQYWKEKGEDRNIIMGRLQSYHGTSFGTLAVGSHKLRRDMFEQHMMPAMHALPCDSYRGQRDGESDGQYVARLMEDMEAQIMEAGRDKVAAVIIEPVVGAVSSFFPCCSLYLTLEKSCGDVSSCMVTPHSVNSCIASSWPALISLTHTLHENCILVANLWE